MEREALYSCPSQAAAERFSQLVKQYKATPEQQKAVVKRMARMGRFGYASINQAFVEFFPAIMKDNPSHPGYYDVMLMKATKQIENLIYTLATIADVECQTAFFVGPKTREDISQQAKDDYHEAANRLCDWMIKASKKLDP